MREVSLVLIMFTTLLVHSETFVGHYREREPEMTISEDFYGGPIAEIVETALKKMGHRVEWKDIPWVRSLSEAKVGTVDILPGHSMNQQRARYLNPILLGYEEREVYFYISPTLDIDITSYKDLNKYKIAVMREVFYFDRFNSDNTLNKIDVTSYDQITTMLKNGRVDLAIVMRGRGLFEVEKIEGLKRASYVESFLNGRYLSIPKESSMVNNYEPLSAVIYKMRKDREIDRIFSKYGLTPYIQLFNTEESRLQESFTTYPYKNTGRTINIKHNESLPWCGTEDGDAIGLVVDIMNEVSKRSGLIFEYERLPWARALKEVQSTDNSLIIPITRTRERERYYNWISIMVKHQPRITYLSTNSDIDNGDKSVDSFKDKRVGIIKSSAIIPTLEKMGFTNLYEGNTIQNIVKMLKTGRIDAMVDSTFVDSYMWSTLGHKNIQLLHGVDLGESKFIYVASGFDFPESISEHIQDIVEEIRADGTMEEIYQRWLK